MSTGLTLLGFKPSRIPRKEFVTLTDPFIEELMKNTLPIGILQELDGFSRSYYSLDAHLESILKYDKPILCSPSTPEWTETIREAHLYFANLPKVQTLSASSTRRDFDNVRYHEGTSAGYGYLDNTSLNPTHKGPRTGENYRRAIRIASRIVHECREHHNAGKFKEYLRNAIENSTPDIAFTRTQLIELPETKVRNVFGECFHYVLLEGLVAYPLIEQFMSIDSFYFIGKDPIIGVPKLIDSLPVNAEQFVTIDWSSFDSSVQPYEIELAFSLIRSMLIFPDLESRLVFEYTAALFCERKLASPDGRLFMRKGGIPSGSYYTHLIDSVINWIRIKYLFKLHKIQIASIHTHGDDALVVPVGRIYDFDSLVDKGLELGWIIKKEKSRLCCERYLIEFLGRYSHGRENARDTMKTLRLLLYPEYPVVNPRISLARIKSIDEDSGYRVPYLPNLVCAMHSRYGSDTPELPIHFRRFNLTELFTTPLGI